jgi:GNAT superfamily N-acetyltransferase
MWYIHAIGTLPEYQGTGQGKALLKHIEARARVDKGKMALLAISQPNESLLSISQIALGLLWQIDFVYKKAGFYPVVDEVIKLNNGIERPYCFMLHDCAWIK